MIELLVVVAIIAILASMLLPALRRARESATRIVCGSNQRQFAVAFSLYADDYDGLYPLHYTFLPASLRFWTSRLHVAGVLTHEQQASLACPSNEYRAYQLDSCRAKYSYHTLMGNRISSSVTKPSHMPLLADAALLSGTTKCTYYFWQGFWQTQIGFDVHESGANVLFLDGHVRGSLTTSTFDPNWVDPVYHGF
ncbi:MAG: prepilin-type N-terminal cleavage/methylation domain-containing protein [Kiritimatiellales bacterium]|nr:prepilin-type N-terminal cleavage/methylation domain-containing protein [Kiritimatiellales bacterium]